MEKQEEFWDAADVVFEKLCCELHKTLQFLQNQNANNVKSHLMFQIIGQNAEILSGGFNERFSGFQMY